MIFAVYYDAPGTSDGQQSQMACNNVPTCWITATAEGLRLLQCRLLHSATTASEADFLAGMFSLKDVKVLHKFLPEGIACNINVKMGGALATMPEPRCKLLSALERTSDSTGTLDVPIQQPAAR
jgi:hypothetical protein